MLGVLILRLRNAASCIVLGGLEALSLCIHLELLLLTMLGKRTTSSCRLLREGWHEDHLFWLLELLSLLGEVTIVWVVDID